MARNTNPHAFALSVARLKYWSWWIFSKSLLGVICIGIVAEGIRLFVPALGQKLHRMAGMGFLKNFEETHSLDIAPFLALILMVSVWYLAERLVRSWLVSEPEPTGGTRLNTDRESYLLTVLAFVLLGVDCVMFYAASAQMRWGGSGLSLSSLIATVGYLGALLFVSYVCAKLSVEVEALKELYELEEQEQRDIERDAAANAAFAREMESLSTVPISSQTSLGATA